MPIIPGSRFKKLLWTNHAQAKMQFYKLSRQRVLRVIQTPKRIEEGVAPKTIAMMQPASVKTTAGRPASFKIMAGRPTFRRSAAVRKETWSQEIWVMVQDSPGERKVISAWRYPGVTKPRSEAAVNLMRKEFEEYKKEV